MAPEDPRPESTDETPSAARWRMPLLVGTLCAVLFAVYWVTSRAKQESRSADACFRALFTGQVSRALEIFREYRERTQDSVPLAVRDEVLRLERFEKYPLVPDQFDANLLERTVFLCLASSQACLHARTERGAVLRAMEYVRRNVQSGGGSPEARALSVTAHHVLVRGFGSPLEVAWVLSALLRYQGLHAAVVQLPPTAAAAKPYAIVGVLIDRKLFLFDPYRAVPLCRAGDGRIADLDGLLSGSETLAPGFGGPGTPVTVAGLRKAAYFVPADVGNVLPDAWLLDRIVARQQRGYVIYRSFRRDLRNLAAAVFGAGAKVKDGFVALQRPGRTELVALWPRPFAVDQRLHAAAYQAKVVAAHRALARVYLLARQQQLHRMFDLANESYDEALKRHPDDADAVQDITFFRALSADGSRQRARRLAAYLKQYPKGRWVPLAALRLAEIETWHRNKRAVADLAVLLENTPYALRSRLLLRAANAGRRRIGWRYPRPAAPSPATTPPAATR